LPKNYEPRDVPTLDFRKHEDISPFLWSVNNIYLPKGAKWDFSDRAWQIDIFDDMSPTTAVIKPTQIGLTMISVCRYFHFALRHSARLMYTLPRQDDVSDLVNSRVDEMIATSPVLASSLQSIDNVRMKKIGDSFMHFMEASVPPRMLDVDYLVNDEVDLSDQGHLEQYISRLDASKYGEHHRLSTPTIDNFGIHALYQQSDKKVWMIKCPACGIEFEMDWDQNIRDKDGRAWYACAKCDKVLSKETIQGGNWVQTGPSGASVSGYSISQMMTTYIPPEKLLVQSKIMTRKNFYNLRLGKPFTSSVGNISRAVVYDNCFQSKHPHEGSGFGYYLGCDQGNVLHVAIGKLEEGVMKIVHLEEIGFDDGFGRLGELMRKYRIRRGVIDALPNKHSAMSLIKNHKGKLYAATFVDGGEIYKMKENEQRVLIHKPDGYDNLQEMISSGMIQFYGSRSIVDDTTREAVLHLGNMRRDEVERKSSFGGAVTRIAWVNTGPDHFADAILYLTIAADSRGGSGFSVVQIGKRDDDAIEDSGVVNLNPYASKRSITQIRRKGMAR